VYVVRKWPLRGRSLFCVLEYHTSKSVVTVQRAFRAKYAKDSPTDKTIRAWYKQFTETGCLADLKARIIAPVKNIDAPMLTCVCVWGGGKNLNIVSMWAVSPMVHTSNISSC
jgi:hypothetical protein